jgi:hypothetical protein
LRYRAIDETLVSAKLKLYRAYKIWYLIIGDLVVGERLLLIEDTNLGSKLIDLAIIGEHRHEWTWCPRLAIAVDIYLVGTVGQSLNDSIKNRLHQCVVLSRTRTYVMSVTVDNHIYSQLDSPEP